MKDLETTWSHIVARKLAKVREERGMTVQELADKIWVSNVFVSTVLARSKKWNEEFFMKAWTGLWLPKQKIETMLHESLLEAIEDEYWIWMAFALKTRFKLSDKWVRDAMKFLNDLAKNDKE